jgi:uncharacterized repeat protein (TIGR03803 family)
MSALRGEPWVATKSLPAMPDSIGCVSRSHSTMNTSLTAHIFRVAWTIFFVGAAILPPSLHGQTIELLHSFGSFGGTNGIRPDAALTLGNDGNFYGTTFRGGMLDHGTIFRITAAGVLTRLFSFGWTNGAVPLAALVQGSDGNFYGTTYQGGAAGGHGTIFKITTNGLLTTLVSFNGTNPAGRSPYGQLLETSDGSFYGTTASGGTYDAGTVFKVTPNGTFTSLVSFNFTNGAGVVAGLIRGNDGDFYGTAEGGGAYGGGTVFRLTPTGNLTTLLSFAGADGAEPEGSLLQTSDGNFYGTTSEGGPDGVGTVFRMTPSGVLTTLAFFNQTNTGFPSSGLIQGQDGNLYGTTQGSEDDYGAVFKVMTNGVLALLVSFNGTNGAYPSGLILGKDGNFYGTTLFGGANNEGTVFRIVMPVLHVAKSGNQIVLSWSTNAVGFTLQSALSLTWPANWVEVTNAPALFGGQWAVTNTFSGDAKFYRLRNP